MSHVGLAGTSGAIIRRGASAGESLRENRSDARSSVKAGVQISSTGGYSVDRGESTGL